MAERTGRGRARMQPWSDLEVQVVRDTADWTAAEVAMRLGRTPSSVAHMRTRLRADEGLTWGHHLNIDPNAVGLRRLVAKTCSDCGVVMDAKWFRRNQQAGCWTSTCTACRRGPRSDVEREGTQDRNRRSQTSMRASIERFQRATIPAAKAGQEWTTTDLGVLADPDLTILDKALRLGRTYKATVVALSRGGHTSRVGLGDREQGRWQIENPYVVA